MFVPESNVQLKDIKIIDVKCGGFHNVACSQDNEYYLWGSNDYRQCLIYNKTDNEKEERDESDNQCIKIPTKYDPKSDLDDKYEIVNIYPGHTETIVVTVCCV